MYNEKRLDGLMKFTAAAYLLVLLGYIEVAAVAYLLLLFGWLVKVLFDGFKIGQVERFDYRERKRNWTKTAVRRVPHKGDNFVLKSVVSE